MNHLKQIAFLGFCLAPGIAAAERINHEGRILGPPPVVTNSVLFNTTHADAILAAMQIFPPTNAWNEDISRRPVLPNSSAMIAQIIADLDAINTNRRNLRVFYEMNFVLVPTNQPRLPINFDLSPDESYPEESDLDGGTFPFGSYPIPMNLPIETWPRETATLTLPEWQEDINEDGGDRHSIMVQPESGFIWETWLTKRIGTAWQAANGAKFDLKSNALRTPGWTSGDAAGLAMFPALPRYDECQRGMVEHACRIVVARSRKEYIYPANHHASSTPATQTNVPAMGQRVRLKSSFVIPEGWTTEEKALLKGLKKYGALVADNGGFFSISVTPDDRWPANAFSHISSIGITNFEVIQTTGPNEGPRSPGAPTADAGTDRATSVLQPLPLQGVVSSAGSPTTNQWKLYSGPGTVAFGNAAQTNTTASFSATGVYTLMFSADDGVHAVAYDAMVVTVTQAISVTMARLGTNVSLTWTGGAPPFVVERTDIFPALWNGILTTSVSSATLPISASNSFFRIRAQ